MLDYYMPRGEECASLDRGRLPSVYAWCEPVLFTSAEQSENIIMEGMHLCYKRGRALIFFFTLKSISPTSAIPHHQEGITNVIKNDFYFWMSDRTVPTEKAGTAERNVV